MARKSVYAIPKKHKHLVNNQTCNYMLIDDNVQWIGMSGEELLIKETLTEHSNTQNKCNWFMVSRDPGITMHDIMNHP